MLRPVPQQGKCEWIKVFPKFDVQQHLLHVCDVKCLDILLGSERQAQSSSQGAAPESALCVDRRGVGCQPNWVGGNQQQLKQQLSNAQNSVFGKSQPRNQCDADVQDLKNPKRFGRPGQQGNSHRQRKHRDSIANQFLLIMPGFGPSDVIGWGR